MSWFSFPSILYVLDRPHQLARCRGVSHCPKWALPLPQRECEYRSELWLQCKSDKWNLIIHFHFFSFYENSVSDVAVVVLDWSDNSSPAMELSSSMLGGPSCQGPWGMGKWLLLTLVRNMSLDIFQSFLCSFVKKNLLWLGRNRLSLEWGVQEGVACVV